MKSVTQERGAINLTLLITVAGITVQVFQRKLLVIVLRVHQTKWPELHGNKWEDYKRRFQPYEDRLAAAYANGGLLEGERDRIPTTIDQSFNSMKGIADRGLSRYGMTSSADETKARDRSMGLNKSLASVDAYNTLYRVADERQDKLMTGGLSGVDSRGKQS